VFEAGHTIAEVVHADTTISQGAQYYSIDGTSVRMTQSAVDHVNAGNALPLLEVFSNNKTASLVTQRFAITDDLDVGYVNGGRQRDLQSMLVRKQDATDNFHSAVYLRTQISSLNLEPSDTLVDASFTMYQGSGSNADAEAGTVQLLVLADASWNESSLTYFHLLVVKKLYTVDSHTLTSSRSMKRLQGLKAERFQPQHQHLSQTPDTS
jgi:hypothetical protein